jgi:hypothetical protein
MRRLKEKKSEVPVLQTSEYVIFFPIKVLRELQKFQNLGMKLLNLYSTLRVHEKFQHPSLYSVKFGHIFVIFQEYFIKLVEKSKANFKNCKI